MNLDTLGGRRFMLTVGCGVVNAALLYWGKLSDGGYVTITLATVAAYVGANTYQKVKGPAP